MNDLTELEIAFTAFAKITIDMMLEAKAATPEGWSSSLLKVSEALRESESFQAAGALERLAVFAEERSTQQALRDATNTGAPQ